MAQVFNKLYVDVRAETTDIITAVQNDANSRFLDVFLLDNGLPINLTGQEVRIYGIKGDTTEFYNNGTITEATNGRCQFELTDQALAVANDLSVQIVIYYNNVQILQSLPFKIHVVASLISSGSVESSNEYGALVVLYQNLYEAYDLMTEMVQKIGVPGTNAQALSLDTMFEVWDYMVTYLEENSSAGVVDKVDSIIGYTATNNTASKTGTLSQKESYGISLLENATYGLSALKTTLIGGNIPVVKSVQKGLITSNGSSLATYTVSMSSINALKSFVILGTYSNAPYNGCNYVLHTLTNTNFTIGCDPAIVNKTMGVSWQVIEFY